jgi:hypothetical protein
MKVSPLFNEEAAQYDANLVVEFTHEDLTMVTDATAQTIPLFQVLANYQMVECVRFELIEPFENTAEAGNNTTAIVVGDDGSTNRLLTSTELNRNGTEVYIKAGTGTKHVFAADNWVDMVVAAAAAGTNHAELNKGRAKLFFRVFDSRGL